MFKRFISQACVWFADRHTACAALWNDIAEAVLTGKSITEVKKNRQGESDDRRLDR